MNTQPPDANSASNVSGGMDMEAPFEAPSVSHPSGQPFHTISLEAHHAEFASFHEDYVRHYIEFADAKAGVCLGLISAVLGYMASRDEVQALITNPTFTIKFSIVAGVLVTLLSSAAFAFAVIAPRLSPVSGEGIIFFKEVAKRKSGEDYVREIASYSNSDLTIAQLRHCFHISTICSWKYRLLRAAIWLALPGLIFALLSILLL
jgi:Family of unknown function (DUF5706)